MTDYSEPKAAEFAPMCSHIRFEFEVLAHSHELLETYPWNNEHYSQRMTQASLKNAQLIAVRNIVSFFGNDTRDGMNRTGMRAEDYCTVRGWSTEPKPKALSDLEKCEVRINERVAHITVMRLPTRTRATMPTNQKIWDLVNKLLVRFVAQLDNKWKNGSFHASLEDALYRVHHADSDGSPI